MFLFGVAAAVAAGGEDTTSLDAAAAAVAVNGGAGAGAGGTNAAGAVFRRRCASYPEYTFVFFINVHASILQCCCSCSCCCRRCCCRCCRRCCCFVSRRLQMITFMKDFRGFTNEGRKRGEKGR